MSIKGTHFKHTEEAKRKIGLAAARFMKGRKLSEETKKKISLNNARFWLGKTKLHTEETKRKMSITRTGMPGNNKGKHWKISPEGLKNHHFLKSGENHPRWISDRTKLAKRQQRSDMAYKEWRKQVWTRDGYRCQMKNNDCRGKIEAHHILSWIKFPELRYEVKNGITLCHHHHPRSRVEENRLSPYFQEIINKLNY